MHTALGKTARIEGNNAIGLSQPVNRLPDPHGNQGAMIPPCGADEVLDDLSLHVDERRNVRFCRKFSYDVDLRYDLSR